VNNYQVLLEYHLRQGLGQIRNNPGITHQQLFEDLYQRFGQAICNSQQVLRENRQVLESSEQNAEACEEHAQQSDEEILNQK
jgi:hypothetical protein